VVSVAPDLRAPTPRGLERLLSELHESWSTLADISRRLVETSQATRLSEDPPKTLAQTIERYERTTCGLLIGPVEEFARVRPIRRSLEAMQEFDREASGAAVRLRARTDLRFQALMAEAALDLCEPWRIRRSGGTQEEWQLWGRRIGKREKRGQELLAAYQKWATKAEKKNKVELEDSKRQERVELWWRKQNAVSTMHEMETAFRDLGVMWLKAAEELVVSLRQEREEVLGLAEKMVGWITAGAKAGTVAPIESMLLASCEERLRAWSGQVENEASKRLPEKAELIDPGRPSRWRTMQPREAFHSAYTSFCQPAMAESARAEWERTARIVREASRSKEIIDYWRDTASSQGERGEALFAEACNNAAHVLAELQKPASEETIEPKLVETFLTWEREGSTVLEAAQIGWVELLRMPRGRRLSGAVIREGKRRSTASIRKVANWGNGQWQRGLEVIGGKLPERPAAIPVIRRTTLRDTLALPASKNELPPIYRSLFRLAPIEDRRFLVGRDRELSGLEQALKDWEAGRFAACVFVGARGSGKTSLLNCAASGAFSGREIIRTQFTDRAVTPEAMDGFLRQMLGLTPDGDVERALREKRRILMIEEGERIFLRKVGGFQGARQLMNLIQRTASTTLWVLAVNDKAFRVLRAGAQFSRVFSHRINAMSVSRADLEKAILERHRLSGLRLEFAPPPAGDPRVGRVKNWLGLEDSSQKLYFDSLFQQSGGVFRSAFELWLSSIEKVEGETLKIRQPLEPAFASLRSELAQEDLFTLLIIQEHGSLEYDEADEVFCEEMGASRERIDRLVALGLLEADPEHPGFRVRPEAHRFTSAVLRRVNLVGDME
jgi:AAA ATPase domain